MPGDEKELIQYLFDANNDDRNFEERFQSFLDQIPKPSGASAAPEKEGFFINFFAGMFASLGSTRLVAKLKLKGLHFWLDGEELHIIAEKDGEKHLFIFSESKERDSNAKLKEKIKNVGKDLESSATKVLIGREILEGDGQKWKFKVLVEHQEGNDPEVTGDFEKVDCKADENLEGSVAELTTGDFKDGKENIEKIIQGAKKLYSDLKGKELITHQGKEAAQHGFISGILVNFRYRYNLRLYLELLIGRGYGDIMLLVRGEGRSWTAIPIIMELKTDGNVDNALEEAKSYARGLRRNKMRMLTNADKTICMGINLNEQDEYYKISEVASEIKRNEEPVMQSLFNIVYGNGQSKVKEVKKLLGQLYYTFPPEQYTKDYLSRFLLGQVVLLKKPEEARDIKLYVFNHSEKNIQDRLTTFMVVVEKEDYENKIFVFHVQEASSEKSKYRNYSFYEEVLGEIGLTQEKVGPLNLIEVYINGYKETGPSQSAPSPGSFYQNRGLVEIENRGPRGYFKDSSSQGRQKRSSQKGGKFEGKVQQIDQVSRLIKEFKKAIKYQQINLKEQLIVKESIGGKGTCELGAYKDLFDKIKELMCNKSGKPKKTLINSENRFKAFLDGLFTGLSDLDKDRVIAVLTEFQVGGGGRVDIMIQVVDNKNPGKNRNIEELKESVSVGFELKYSGTTEDVAKGKLKEAESQVERYANSKNIKSITEGDRVAFIAVVFNTGKKGDLILVSEKFIVAGVEHSSTDVSRASVPSSQLGQVSAPQPSTSRGVGDHRR